MYTVSVNADGRMSCQAGRKTNPQNVHISRIWGHNLFGVKERHTHKTKA
jgi:hypothetical protein